MAPKRPASIKVRALQWLAQREHSRSELRGKLLRALAAEGDAEAAAREVDVLLDALEAGGYLSQARFVESRVRTRQVRFGNLRIRQELAQHGLAPDAQTQAELKASELGRAREVWRKKYGAPAAEAAGRVRQMRFLTGRGFSPEVVRRVVKGDDDVD